MMTPAATAEPRTEPSNFSLKVAGGGGSQATFIVREEGGVALGKAPEVEEPLA